MPEPLAPEVIYALARRAGFSPDQAVTMTAIALAASGGDPGAHHSNGGDCRGLWQIDMSPQANGDTPWEQELDLYDPLDNARAAWEVSRHGADIAPWTATPSDRGSRYRAYLDEATAAAGTHGESGVGNVAGPDRPPPVVDELPTGDINRFLQVALAQTGDRGWVSAIGRAEDPGVFDCAELVEWAAAQVDVDVGATSHLQYLNMKGAGTLIDLPLAIATPGALLFTFSGEPEAGGTRPSTARVAISLGDGRVIEASGTGVIGVFDAGPHFHDAALIPGMDYSGAAIPMWTALAPVSPPTDPSTIAPPSEGAIGTDMLPDHFEITYGLLPDQADTDGDGITDGYELIVRGTQATMVESDVDHSPDDAALRPRDER